jgi:hypothetical protein
MSPVRACCLVLLAAALFAAPAAAHFPQSINSTLAPDGESIETSSPVPPTATSATITSSPTDSGDAAAFNTIVKMLSATSSPKERLLTCLGLTLGLQQIYSDPGDEKYVLGDRSLQVLFMNACLQLAFGSLSAQSGTAAVPATASCPRTDFQTPMHVTRSGGKYQIVVTGKSTKPKKRSPLVTVCKRKGAGIQITLKPRLRKKKLVQVLGNKLSIGYLNPSNGKTLTVHTTFAVH